MVKKRKLLLIFFILTFTSPLFSQIDFKSSNLPIIVIDTEGRAISDEPKVTAKMKIISNATGTINRVSDTPNNFNGWIGIEFRGASSQGLYEKKSFGIETRDAAGDDLDVSLLGMPKESDWVLYAPYGDKSMMRDVLTYHIGNKAGKYSTRTNYCELVLNGQYQGVYILMEKIKRNKNRVNINKLDPNENSGDDLTGGYIVKIDKLVGSGGDGWYSKVLPYHSVKANPIYFQYEYPKPENISVEQKNYIQNFFTEFENTLKSPTFNDPKKGYSKYIDVPSFIDYFLITELCKNIDGYRLSTFLYKEKDSDGGKLHAGPLWDYNLAYGNANYCQGSSFMGWARDFNKVCPQDDFSVPFWWETLLTDPLFSDQVLSRWLEMRETFLTTDNINKYLDSTALRLEEAQQRNYTRWPIIGKYVWPNDFIGKTYNEEVAYLKNWISKRIDWIDQNLDKITSIEKERENFILSVYPNPFQEKITFVSNTLLEKKTVIKIYDLFGKNLAILDSSEKSKGSRSWDWNGKVNEKETASGIYLYTLEIGGKIIESKLIQKTQ